MFDIGWMELMVIGVVALIVVGPKDLPEMFRQLGRFTAKLRQMGREFSRAMEQAAKDSGVDEVRRDLRTATQPLSSGIESLKSAADRFEKWDPVKNAGLSSGPQTTPLTPPPLPPMAPPKAAPAPSAGPATQALFDKQAARKAIMDEMNAKLKALDAAPPAPETPPGGTKRPPGRTRKSKVDKE